MPQDYVEIPVGDGTEIPFAVDDPTYDGPVPAGKIRSSVQNGVTASLESGAGLVRRIADTVRKEIDSLDDRPDKVTVEVGLTATASGQIVVAATSAQAHINIGMEWSGDRRA